ncbi:MAG: flagellar basal-body rod protein FlgC [Halioglobus sp.]|jgi:flagellar basal-body rod protein FlgC
MSLFQVFDISATAMSAQSVRLNTIASNLANAAVVSSSPEEAYRSRHPVFSTAFDSFMSDPEALGVKVNGVVESTVEPRKEYSPGHPLANGEGFIYRSNVDSVQEMTNMISASRSYQSSVEAMNTTKQLIMRTLTLGT